MKARLVALVSAVSLGAGALLAANPPGDLAARWLDYLGWTGVCLLAELLWIESFSGEGTESMASTANYAVALLWPLGATLWIVALSTLLAGLLVQRRVWYRALFNASQMALTMFVACHAFVALGGPARGLVAQPVAADAPAAVMALALPAAVLCVTYQVVHRLFVGAAVAWSTDRGYLRTLREEYLHVELATNDAALFLLSPLVVISYQAVGYLGLALFFVPMVVIRNSYVRYVELRKAQETLIHRERMAAKGEMAAEIGHELSNYLAAISGRAQMLLRDVGEASSGAASRHAKIIWEQAANMATLTKGLMDFSNPEVRVQRVDVNQVVQDTVEFVRPQNKYDHVEFELNLRGDLSQLDADPGQLQQVFLNLFSNAADAMAARPVDQRRIRVSSDWAEAGRSVRVDVVDSGSGIPPADLRRIFEPAFTTKPSGHGFGLSTSYRIAANHRGRIEASNEPGGGARFTLVLPVAGSSPPARAG